MCEGLSFGRIPSNRGKHDVISVFPNDKVIAFYTKFFEVAGLRLPLSDFIKEVLCFYGICISLMSPQGMCKIIAFEVISKCLDQLPSLGLFRSFFRVGTVKGWWYTIERRPKVPEIVSTRDSLKRWHTQFLFLNRNKVYSGALSLSCHKDKRNVLRNNNIPKREEYDVDLFKFISENIRVDLRKCFLEPMLVYCGMSKIGVKPGKTPVPFLHHKRMSWSKLCSGPFDPALKFKLLPPESSGSSRKFVVPRMSLSDSENVEDAEADASGSGDLITRKRGLLPNNSEPAAKKMTTSKKNNSNDCDSSLQVKSPGFFDSPDYCESVGKILEDLSPSSHNHIPQADDSVKKTPLQAQPSVSSDKGKTFGSQHTPGLHVVEGSLSMITEKLRGLGLYEKAKPSQVIDDSSTVYVPDWSITRGSVINTVSERMGFMLRSLPPGIQDIFSQSPNSKLVDNYSQLLICSLAAGQELINCVTQYETDVRVCLEAIAAIGHDEYRRKQEEEVIKLHVQVLNLHTTNRTKLIKIKSLESELSACKKAVSNVEFMSECLKFEKERYKKLEFENVKSKAILQKGLEEEKEKNSLLKEQLEALRMEVEKEKNIRRRISGEVISQVVSKVKGSSDFIEPFKKVIDSSMGK